MREAFARQVQDLTNAIADGTPMEVSAEDGLKAVEMVEAVTRSAETGHASAALWAGARSTRPGRPSAVCRHTRGSRAVHGGGAC